MYGSGVALQTTVRWTTVRHVVRQRGVLAHFRCRTTDYSALDYSATCSATKGGLGALQVSHYRLQCAGLQCDM